MSDLSDFEDEAEAFYQATGYLRPGKDEPSRGGTDPYMRNRFWHVWSEAIKYAEKTKQQDNP